MPKLPTGPPFKTKDLTTSSFSAQKEKTKKQQYRVFTTLLAPFYFNKKFHDEVLLFS